jgi:hypothetical protein
MIVTDGLPSAIVDIGMRRGWYVNWRRQFRPHCMKPMSLAQANAIVADGRGTGIAVFLQTGDPIASIDLDDCSDENAADGLTPFARAVIDDAGSYTYWSHDRQSVTILGTVARRHCKITAEFRTARGDGGYAHARTDRLQLLSADRVWGTPLELRPIGKTIARLLAGYEVPPAPLWPARYAEFGVRAS